MVTNHIGPDAVIHGTVIQTSGGTTVPGARRTVVNSISGARIAGLVIQAGAVNGLDLGDEDTAESTAPGTGQDPQTR
ncbi:hypothetical protein F7Q99_38240 [Streptomyces kaniharaensis]|uniref:Uncharacterized protein n=1 Tax=Streptomyces kaniharaensis TaxID=212423 RepID=A0A6N7L3Q5_9ACTN|nr:hypothetical protein [Streptomyces kaniharaensis]MQS17875.1 hypothetical protein [Streptomyces kaniharaensis]